MKNKVITRCTFLPIFYVLLAFAYIPNQLFTNTRMCETLRLLSKRGFTDVKVHRLSNSVWFEKFRLKR